MELPDSLLDKVGIDKWTVFKGPFPNDDNQNKKHICIIIKVHDHESEDTILYFYMTSNEGALKYNKKDIHSVVTLETGEVKEYFDKPNTTYIQCGKPYLYSIKLKDYKRKVAEGSITQFNDLLESEKQSKISNAINSSRTYNSKQKSRLLE